jgi:hypothetical protein
VSGHIIRIHRDAKISIFSSKKASLVHVFRGEKKLPFFDRLFDFLSLPLHEKQQQQQQQKQQQQHFAGVC